MRCGRATRAVAAVGAVTALAACGAQLSAMPFPPAAAAPIPSASASPISSAGSTANRVGPPPLGSVPDGQRPPQIVVVAFDGAGVAVGNKYPMFQFWRDVSRQHNARFTFFLSGPYLLPESDIGKYLAPQIGPAHSGLGMEVDGVLPLPGQTPQDAIRFELEELRDANAEGNEIGTHFNGHICGGGRGSVGAFTASDWEQEIDQFDQLLDNANQNNNLNPPVNLGFTSKDVVGSRTPCLEGNFTSLYPVLAEHGYRYDTSPTPDTTWPLRGTADTGPSNLWVFPLAWVNFAGTTHHVLSMDYNICFLHDGCQTSQSYPSSVTDRWRQQALDTYRHYFEQSYTGDRAPIYLGNHFEMWHDGAYTDALAEFVTETCGKPEVRCVSYRDLADWLDTVPDAQRHAWRMGEFPHYVDSDPPPYGEPVSGAPQPQAAPPIPTP
ncbi:MAG TPA: hypothetical protein VGJ14_05935 [Sporichthyaceae bacterium]